MVSNAKQQNAEARQLERRAIDAMDRRDARSALVHLAAALERCDPGDTRTAIRLAEAAVEAARSCVAPRRGRELVAKVMQRDLSAGQRGRLLSALSKIAALEGDKEKVLDLLIQAANAFARAGDKKAEALALADMALTPVGVKLSAQDCILIGRESYKIARQTGDRIVVARCAGSLAVSLLHAGEASGFRYWKVAREVLRGSRSAKSAHVGLVGVINETSLALSFGDYVRAKKSVARARRAAIQPVRIAFVEVIDAMLAWRQGRWDDADSLLSGADLTYAYPEVHSLASSISFAIRFERQADVPINQIELAVKKLVSFQDFDWAALTMSVLIQARLARREPNPERGVWTLARALAARGVAIGWDDLLPAMASVGNEAHQRFMSLLGQLNPKGPRAEAAILFSGGLVGLRQRSPDAVEHLDRAAALYSRVGDRFYEARALESAGIARRAAGRGPEGCESRAAAIYRDIGAERSLASLLRRVGRLRELRDFHIPESQRYSTPGFTPRESEVAELAARGLTTAAIAVKLGISPSTARIHVDQVKRKLGVTKKSDLVAALAD